MYTLPIVKFSAIILTSSGIVLILEVMSWKWLEWEITRLKNCKCPPYLCLHGCFLSNHHCLLIVAKHVTCQFANSLCLQSYFISLHTCMCDCPPSNSLQKSVCLLTSSWCSKCHQTCNLCILQLHCFGTSLAWMDLRFPHLQLTFPSFNLTRPLFAKSSLLSVLGQCISLKY